jgi:hypothetical protein
MVEFVEQSQTPPKYHNRLFENICELKRHIYGF